MGLVTLGKEWVHWTCSKDNEPNIWWWEDQSVIEISAFPIFLSYWAHERILFPHLLALAKEMLIEVIWEFTGRIIYNIILNVPPSWQQKQMLISRCYKIKARWSSELINMNNGDIREYLVPLTWEKNFFSFNYWDFEVVITA